MKGIETKYYKLQELAKSNQIELRCGEFRSHLKKNVFFNKTKRLGIELMTLSLCLSSPASPSLSAEPFGQKFQFENFYIKIILFTSI